MYPLAKRFLKNSCRSSCRSSVLHHEEDGLHVVITLPTSVSTPAQQSPAVVQANIKVQGSNGRNQMLKLWLPGLMQLMGDHSKAAVVKHTDINELLDPETGLRHLQDE